MLNIPESVKTLFKRDGVRKNFRVHFPNGETTDLNNENIVSESVQFTESLCSQQYFKFGLAEASQIEFTAVGIPNILGAVIDCAMEIDCTSLGSTWAEENPVDNTLDWLEPQTCEYDSKIYYRVPYGRFKVDSCPRDHGAMWQRKITAYTEQWFVGNEQVIQGEFPNKEAILNPMVWFSAQNVKVEQMTHVEMRYRPIAPSNHVDSEIGLSSGSSTSSNALSAIRGLALAKISTSGADSGYVQGFGYNASRPLGWYLLQVEYTSHEFDEYYGSLMDAAVASLPSGNYVYDGIPGLDDSYVKAFNNTKDAVRCRLGGMAPSISIAVRYRNNGKTFIRNSKPIFIKSGERYILDLKNFSTFEFYTDPPNGYVLATTMAPVLLYVRVPVAWSNYYGGGDSSNYPAYWIYGSNWATISGWENAAPFDGRNFVQRDGVVDVYYKNLDDSNFPAFLVQSTLEFKKSGGLGTYYTYSNAVSALKMLESTMEILGEFWKAYRNGESGEFKIGESQAIIPISGSDWEEFWWDENDVEPIGTVGVKMLSDSEDENENQSEQLVQYSIGSGESVYLMEDNEVLSNTTATVDEIQDVLNEYFAPNASVVNFTPVDLSMRGLPYLEDGDYIQLTAEDGSTVNTYILEQTISGIQHLTADVTSTNGELLEVIEE